MVPLLSHLTDEYPDQPESARDTDHETVKDELKETVTTATTTNKHDVSFRVVKN
jgi:hypothetical protein